MKNLVRWLKNKGTPQDVAAANALLAKGQRQTKHDKPVTKQARRELNKQLGGC